MKNKIISILFLASVFLFLGFYVTNAQVRSTDIGLSVSPQYPEPGESAEVSISSYSIDLSKTYVSWWINNNEVSRGVGKTSISFTMGNIGTSTTVTANIDTVDGQSLSKSITLLSSGIDILWEATDSYVPPFYKGKALGTRESEFKVVAIPQVVVRGQKVSNNNLSYTWRKDGNGQPKSSGWGKSYFVFSNSFLDANNQVSVEVSDVNGTKIGEGETTITTSTPKIVFYENNPNTGNLKALSSNTKISKDGISIYAMPYFFSKKAFNSGLEYRWFVGGQENLSLFSRKNITVKGQEDQSGSGIVKVVINNTKTLFQSAEQQVKIEF